MDRLAQLERLEAWCATVNARERFLIGAVVGLIQALQNEDRLSADAALQTFCLMVLNLNEFVYVD